VLVAQAFLPVLPQTFTQLRRNLANCRIFRWNPSSLTCSRKTVQAWKALSRNGFPQPLSPTKPSTSAPVRIVTLRLDNLIYNMLFLDYNSLRSLGIEPRLDRVPAAFFQKPSAPLRAHFLWPPRSFQGFLP